MEPLLIIVIAGLLGGLVFALLFIRLGGGPDGGSGDARLEPPSTNIINMARIRVAGVGGLGMVAMAITVAIFVPRIRLTMAIALLLGAALAAVLIKLRRRHGPLGSSNHPGAHSMLLIDTTPPAAPGARRPSSRGQGQELAVIPAKP